MNGWGNGDKCIHGLDRSQCAVCRKTTRGMPREQRVARVEMMAAVIMAGMACGRSVSGPGRAEARVAVQYAKEIMAAAEEHVGTGDSPEMETERALRAENEELREGIETALRLLVRGTPAWAALDAALFGKRDEV